MCLSIPPRPPQCVFCPNSPCLCPVGPGPRVLSHLLLHFCAEPRAPTQGLSHHGKCWMCPLAAQLRSATCRRRYVWGDMDAVVYAFSFCLLSKEVLSAASCQVLQGRSSTSSSLGPKGTSPPPQAKHSLDPVVPVMPHLQTLSCRLAAAGERQELLLRGSAQPGGLSELEKTLWMEKQPGQASRTSAGLTCPQSACCRAQGAARGAQRMLKDLETPTHQPDKPSIFLSPVLITCFQGIHSQAQARLEETGLQRTGSSPSEVSFNWH